jgi:hypothetical protein
MAKIVLGMWTTHGPTLGTTAEQWLKRVPADKKRKHAFRGQEYSFDELVELRKDEDLAVKSSIEERSKRKARCDAAIDVMARKWAEVDPDICVVMGNDQREIFLPDITPALTVFTGDKIYNEPVPEEKVALMPPGIHDAGWTHDPEQYTEYPGCKDLATRIVKRAMNSGFEVAISEEVPRNPDNYTNGIGHAFGFIFNMYMRDKIIPTVPLIANTFFPPNQPRAGRLYEFGQLVGDVIDKWDQDLRVAVVGSGGMSHFCIDEDFDEMFFNAFNARDSEKLCGIDEAYFQSGTSELKNWIHAAGALFNAGLDGDPTVVDYIPCYRSEAGTGTANGFVYWD